jgi:hypothetical protein
MTPVLALLSLAPGGEVRWHAAAQPSMPQEARGEHVHPSAECALLRLAPADQQPPIERVSDPVGRMWAVESYDGTEVGSSDEDAVRSVATGEEEATIGKLRRSNPSSRARRERHTSEKSKLGVVLVHDRRGARVVTERDVRLARDDVTIPGPANTAEAAARLEQAVVRHGFERRSVEYMDHPGVPLTLGNQVTDGPERAAGAVCGVHSQPPATTGTRSQMAPK